LRVEVIESEFDLGGTAARDNIERLRLGDIRIMVDDFGSGASNVHRILELTADAVKLDISLIADIETNPERRRYLGKLASVAAKADVEVIAEGIERESQLRILLDEGFQFGQGFLFARPVPAREVERILQY
jgi:diguanylate cyclase